MPASTATILAFIATIALTIVAYICIIPAKKRDTLSGIGKFFHDLFNFKWLLIEKIVKVCYVLSTIFIVCLGIFYLFSVEEGIFFGWYRNRYDSRWTNHFKNYIRIYDDDYFTGY